MAVLQTFQLNFTASEKNTLQSALTILKAKFWPAYKVYLTATPAEQQQILAHSPVFAKIVNLLDS